MKRLADLVPGVVLVEPTCSATPAAASSRVTGATLRASSIGVGCEFVQDNFSSSVRGMLRGLHYQLAQPQGKLVHVSRGEVFDVAVDIRRGSPHVRRVVRRAACRPTTTARCGSRPGSPTASW